MVIWSSLALKSTNRNASESTVMGNVWLFALTMAVTSVPNLTVRFEPTASQWVIGRSSTWSAVMTEGYLFDLITGLTYLPNAWEQLEALTKVVYLNNSRWMRLWFLLWSRK